jgi:flagellar motility protein MotE (MotC chaperone)
MKPAIVFVASFVVAAAGSTGAKVMLTKPSHSAAADSIRIGVDSTSTDSAAAKPHEAVSDTTHKEAKASAAPSKMVAPVESTAAPIVTLPKTAGKAATTTQKSAAASPSVATAPDSGVEASERRLAKVFTAMEPKQAAKVLEHMADADVQIILGYVGPRQAASIMAELPPERVATLSKRSMQPKAK